MIRKKSLSALPALLAVLLVACGGSTGGPSTSGALAGKTIWYMDILKSNASLEAVAQGMNHVIAGQGGQMIRTFAQTETGGIDLALEAQNMQRAIAAKPAAIGFFELDPKNLKPQVEQAVQAGIPTFGVQGKPDGYEASGWIDFDNSGNGVALANELATAMPAGSKFTIIAPPNTGTVQLVVESGISTLKAKGYTFVGSIDQQRDATDDASGGQQVTQALLQKYPDVKGILAYNDGAALGAVAAIKSLGLRGKIAVTGRNGGDDGIAGVQSGDLLATCDIGALAVGMAVGQAMVDQITGKIKYEHNKAIPNPPGTCIVNSANVASHKKYTDQITYVAITTK
jgi:erythritol transport system substrate-binding protein